MNQVCCCANPDCLAKGCALLRQQKQPLQPIWPTYVAPQPAQPQHGYAVPITMPLTADDVRRIVREEIQRALKEGSTK